MQAGRAYNLSLKHGYDSEAEELREWLELANKDKAEYRKEVEKLKLKVKDLEANRWLTDRFYYFEGGIKRQEVTIPNAIN